MFSISQKCARVVVANVFSGFRGVYWRWPTPRLSLSIDLGTWASGRGLESQAELAEHRLDGPVLEGLVREAPEHVHCDLLAADWNDRAGSSSRWPFLPENVLVCTLARVSSIRLRTRMMKQWVSSVQLGFTTLRASHTHSRIESGLIPKEGESRSDGKQFSIVYLI